MKRTWADKWSMEVLEQIACACNIASNAETEDDWEFFLCAVYEVAHVLPRNQRAILLLSQEHGLSFSDIGRALSMPFNTVRHNFIAAVNVIVAELEKKSLIDLKIREESKIGQEFYSGKALPEVADAEARIGFHHGFTPPWFGDAPNPLLDDD